MAFLRVWAGGLSVPGLQCTKRGWSQLAGCKDVRGVGCVCTKMLQGMWVWEPRGRGVTGSRKEGARGHERAPQDLCWAERGRRPGWGKSPGDPRYRSGPRVPGQASGSTTHPGAPPTQVHTWACAELQGPRGARPRKPTGRPWARRLHTTPHSVPSPVTMAHRLCGCLNPSGTAKSREGCVRPHAPAGRLRTGRDAACKDDPSTHRTRYRGKGRFPLTSKAFWGAKLFFPHQNTAAENMLKGKQKA